MSLLPYTRHVSRLHAQKSTKVFLWSTRELNSRRLARQSQMQPLDQRDNKYNVVYDSQFSQATKVSKSDYHITAQIHKSKDFIRVTATNYVFYPLWLPEYQTLIIKISPSKWSSLALSCTLCDSYQFLENIAHQNIMSKLFC